MAAEPRRLLTHEEYFALEEATGQRYEYVAGRIYAMAGGSTTHGLISINTSTSRNVQLRSRPCFVYSSDVRVAIQELDIYTYPDSSVVCGEPRIDERGGVTNPIALVEILSPAIARYDREGKFLRYQRLLSLQDSILIAQDRPFVQRFSRDERGLWFWETAVGLEATLAVPSIECQLPLDKIYAKVAFERSDAE